MHWLDLGKKKNTYATDTSGRRGLAWVPWHVMVVPSGRASIAFCAHWGNFMNSDRMSWLLKLSFSETSLLILSPEIFTTAELIYNSKVLGQEKTWVLIWFPFLSGTPNGSHNLSYCSIFVKQGTTSFALLLLNTVRIKWDHTCENASKANDLTIFTFKALN